MSLNRMAKGFIGLGTVAILNRIGSDNKFLVIDGKTAVNNGTRNILFREIGNTVKGVGIGVTMAGSAIAVVGAGVGAGLAVGGAGIIGLGGNIAGDSFDNQESPKTISKP